MLTMLHEDLIKSIIISINFDNVRARARGSHIFERFEYTIVLDLFNMLQHI